MADEGTFCTTAEVERKAGANCSAVSKAEEYANDYVKQAESLINAICRFNFTDEYTELNADVKMILKEVASNLAAIYVISYDMSGFTTRVEGEDMINVLRDGMLRSMSILRNQNVVTFINGA